MEIKLASHEHPMAYHDLHDDQSCDKCSKEISGAAYACVRCELWLHESCAKALEHLPREITHPLHSRHRLILDWIGSPGICTCNICLKISSGTSYACCRCDFELDLSCALATDDHHQAMKKKERSNPDKNKMITRHDCHSDPLILYNYGDTEEDDYNCSWCDKPLTGICYGCRPCEFNLHEFCTNKIPKTLNHPFHPSHPLRLQFVEDNKCNACIQTIGLRTSSTSSYICQECNFNLDLYCAKMLPTLKHKCHDHYLCYFAITDFRDNKILEYHHFKCSKCQELCSDSFYRCVQCNLNLHLKCVPIPPSAKHKYHRHPLVLKNLVREDEFENYYCDICEEERNPAHEVYYCEKCTYIAHSACVLNEDEASVEKDSSSSAQSMDLVMKGKEEIGTKDNIQNLQLLVRPLIHEHSLKFYEASEKLEKPYCRACCSESRGPGYICEGCGFYLHENCAQLPDEMHHPLHPQHPLNLYARFPYLLNFIICEECKNFSSGFGYLCDEYGFKLDLKCATRALPSGGSSTSKESEKETEFFHFSHRHKLIFCNFKDPTFRETRCNLCKLQISGPTYFCFRCSWFLHEFCLPLPQEMQVPIHPQHISVLRWKRYGVICYACGLKLSSGYNYCCEECPMNFHIACAISLRRPLKRESHKHDLYYFGTEFLQFLAMYRDFFDIFCSHCGQICSWQPFYRCLECFINFHLECVPIPQIVKSKNHIHPLTLKDSFIEDDSEEHYCDICEEKRHPSDQVYFCEECHGVFVAHLECALANEEEILCNLVPREGEREKKERKRKEWMERRMRMRMEKK